MFGVNDGGKVECALFGDFVDELNKNMGKCISGLPIIVVQFVKVKIFRGNVLCLLNLYFFKCLADMVVFSADKASIQEC